MTDTPWTPDQLAAAGQQVQPPPVATGPDPASMDAKAAAASATEVDVPALLAKLQAQQDALVAEVARLRGSQAPQGEHPLVSTATAARELIATHFDRGYKGDGAAMGRLADDLVDASKNAVASGDTAPARQVAKKLETELNRVHPGPGDHHYFKNALALAGYHYPLAADTVTAAQPSNAPAVAGAPAPKIVAGSVTG
jgi:hypothetical protein